MRKRIVHLHLNDLRVDHHKAQIIRAELEQNAGDNGVDADALAATGGPRHQVREAFAPSRLK